MLVTNISNTEFHKYEKPGPK